MKPIISTKNKILSFTLLILILFFKFSQAQLNEEISDHISHDEHLENHPYYSLSPSLKYSNYPNRGDVVNKLGNVLALRDNLRTTYYFDDGIWYMVHKQGYIVVRPPIGLRLNKIPSKSKKITTAKGVYYYFLGIYYKVIPNSDKKIVVNPPVGLAVDALPSDYHKASFNGRPVFEYDNIYYEPFEISGNRYYYKVCGHK